MHNTPPQPRPNLLVILVDDMGFSDIGCFGSEIRTPNLDRLARNGVRFSQMYNCARCCPTRASLLTGLYPHQAGVGHMVPDRDHPGSAQAGRLPYLFIRQVACRRTVSAERTRHVAPGRTGLSHSRGTRLRRTLRHARRSGELFPSTVHDP